MAAKASLVQSLYAGLGPDVANGKVKFLTRAGSTIYGNVYTSDEISNDNLIDQSATGGVPLDAQGRAVVFATEVYAIEVYNEAGIKQSLDATMNYTETTTSDIDVASDYGITGEAVNEAIAVANANTSKSYKLFFRDNDFNLLNNTIFPSNTQLEIDQSANLVIPSGTDTVTINGFIEAGIYQIFKYDNNTTGVVTLNPYRNEGIYPQWFGGDPDGTTNVSFELGRALASGVKRLVLTGGQYYLGANITIPNDVEVIRCGGSDFTVAAGVTVSGLGVKSTKFDKIEVDTLSVTGTQTTSSSSTAQNTTTDNLVVNQSATVNCDIDINGNSFLNEIQSYDIKPEATGTRSVGSALLEYLSGFFKNVTISATATIADLIVTTLKSNIVPDLDGSSQPHRNLGSSTHKFLDTHTKNISANNVQTDWVPESTNTKDLGKTDKRWRELFVSGAATIGGAISSASASVSGAISAASLAVTGAISAASASISGTITALTGTFTNASITNLTSNLTPDTTNTRHIGSSSKRFRNGYFSNAFYAATATLTGAISAASASISGTITAVTGTFTNASITNLTSSLTPNTTNTRDIGTASKKFKDGFFAGGVTAGSATVTGSVSAGSLTGSAISNSYTGTSQTKAVSEKALKDGLENIQFDSPTNLSNNTVYQASVAGFVVVRVDAYQHGRAHVGILTGSSSTSVTTSGAVAACSDTDNTRVWYNTAICPVNKGEYYKFSFATGDNGGVLSFARFIPLKVD